MPANAPFDPYARPAPRGALRRGKKRKSTGCGCLSVTALAVIVIIGVVGALSMFSGPVLPSLNKQPIPDHVPPAAAAPPPMIDVHAPGRTSDQLHQWAQPIAQQTEVSEDALRAYGNAYVIAAESYPECHLEWNTLAGIGQIETRHGTYSGNWLQPSRIDPDGVVRPPIIGPSLNGTGAFAEVRDTDGGALDGDSEYDRAVGPMQFIPETWARFATDASGDGVADPNNIDDAAATTARMMCSGGRDLSTPEGWASAVRSYNQSEQYLRDVRDAAANYALNQPA
ncbi:lytic transglycosylase domain-containing protein [Corynebacterium lactis]|uniref:lytic transglycosylase domain-containing protein n=1 Tax=Corynebacterium lactis TaxID=1231000 RepID=UPI0006A9D9B7|nr:lytic murein transglycosylase [Corynebacterium lactis]